MKIKNRFRQLKKTVALMILSVGILSCETKQGVQEGTWRGELAVSEGKQAPFLFDVEKTGEDSFTVTLRNGEERVKLTGVTFAGDTLVIPITAYDAGIRGVVKGERMEGRFLKHYIEGDSGVPFSATYGVTDRFPFTDHATETSIDGRWDVLFISQEGDTTRNVGLFKSDEGVVTGSILTSTGDLRFLEGVYTEEGVHLSAFGGLSPYLIETTFTGSDRFEGTFYTTRGTTRLLGSRNEEATLADPYSIATLKEGAETLSFSLPDMEGNTVSLSNERFRDKVVILSILGSWCPNCLDEMAFLAPWYEANRERGVEVVGIAFERKDDFEYAKKAITRLKERYHATYPILFGGEVGRESVEGVLPELENFSGYPTTLFIDRQGRVRKIHTGFSGPATGLFYESFIKDFNTLVDSLLAEDPQS